MDNYTKLEKLVNEYERLYKIIRMDTLISLRNKLEDRNDEGLTEQKLLELIRITQLSKELTLCIREEELEVRKILTK